MATTLSVASSHTLDKPILQGLTTVSSTAAHDIGYHVRASTGEGYTYYQTSTTVTAAPIAGYPAFFDAGTGGDFLTTTQKDGYGHNFAGIFCAALSTTAIGANYLWVQDEGVVPSAAASCGATSVLTAVTGYFSDSSNGSTSYVAGDAVERNAVGLQTHGSTLADVQLI